MLLLLELLLPLPEFGLLPNIKRNRMVSGCCRDISTALHTLFDLFETLCATGAVRVFGCTRVVVACIRWWRESVVWGDCLKRLLQMPIRIEFIKLKIALTISILGYIGPNFVWILVSNHILWICWQNVDMSTKMLTSTSRLTKSCYIDLRSSKCLEASDVNKNVDMSTFSHNRIHVNMQNDCETSIVVANSI